MKRTLLVCLFIPWLAAAQLPEPEIVWECKTGPLVGSVVLFPSVEEPTGVLALTKAGDILLIDAKGAKVWERSLLGEGKGSTWAEASPAIGDLDGDGRPEIVTAMVSGEVVALREDGSEFWRYPLEDRVTDWSAACLPDLDGDGTCEVIIGDQSGWLTCLSGQGERLWRSTVDGYQVSPPGVVPDANGRPAAVLFGTENDHMAAMKPTGELLWLSRHVGQFGRTMPTSGDLDGDGDYETTFITSFNNPDSRVWALDAMTGDLAWSSPLNLHGYVANTIVDLDGDGDNEVVFGIRSDTVYCFDGDGTKRWELYTGGQSTLWSPAIADINGDGKCEVITVTRNTNERGKTWFVLDENGVLLGEYGLGGDGNGAPLVADIDRDGRLDIILQNPTAGFVRCVTFGGKAEGARMPWVSHMHDAARLNYVPATTTPAPTRQDGGAMTYLAVSVPEPVQWGATELKIDWPALEGDRVVVEVSVVDPQGRRATYTRDVAPDKLPETLPITLIGEGNHKATVRLWDTKRWDLPAMLWESAIAVGGVETFASAMQQELASLDATADHLALAAPGTARLLRERRAQRSGALEQLIARASAIDLNHAPNADRLAKEIAAFRGSIAQDVALAQAARTINAERPGLTVAVWEDPNPWDLTPTLLEQGAATGDLAVDFWQYRGEAESRAVTVLNLEAEPVTVQVRANDEAVREAVHFYEVVETLGRDGYRYPDALSELNSAKTLHLAPGEARRLWVTVNSDRLPAGSTELVFDVVSLGASEDRLSVTLRVDVVDLDLRLAPMFRICNWSSPSRLRAFENGADAIRSARDHGMNVFVNSAPTPTCDADGNLVGKVDWTQFDAELDLMGHDGFVLIGGQGVGIPKEVEKFGPVHVKAQRTWLTMLAAHLAEKGFGLDRWALYPVDEPGLFGGTKVELYRQIATHFKEAMPEVPLYANPSGNVTPETMAPMMDITDVWCPEQGVLRRTPELAELFLATGKSVWSYEAPPDSKTQHALGYYRANSWMSFQLGLSGSGFWTQVYTGAHYGGNDLWFAGKGTLFGANYAVADTEVISRRWEAFRDGIEDVRAFMMLRDAAEAARAAGRHAAEVARVDVLLGEEVTKATEVAFDCGDPTRFLRDYEMDYGEIQRIRHEVAELTRILNS